MKQRVLTSLFLAPLVLLACSLATPYPLFCLGVVVVYIGFLELTKLLEIRKALPVLTLVSVFLPFVAVEVEKIRSADQIFFWCWIFFTLGVIFAWNASRHRSRSTAEADLAGLWISVPIACLVLFHNHLFTRPLGPYFVASPVWAVLIPVWVGDICGLLVGRGVGKHLLWAAVSPKKTIEGAIGNLAGALGASALVWHWLPCTKPGPWWAAGCLVGVIGQAGDLFESYLKRKGGAKDSGSILPGHGGLLDRIDSLLFAAPALSIMLYFWPIVS